MNPISKVDVGLTVIRKKALCVRYARALEENQELEALNAPEVVKVIEAQ